MNRRTFLQALLAVPAAAKALLSAPITGILRRGKLPISYRPASDFNEYVAGLKRVGPLTLTIPNAHAHEALDLFKTLEPKPFSFAFPDGATFGFNGMVTRVSPGPNPIDGVCGDYEVEIALTGPPQINEPIPDAVNLDAWEPSSLSCSQSCSVIDVTSNGMLAVGTSSEDGLRRHCSDCDDLDDDWSGRSDEEV